MVDIENGLDSICEINRSRDVKSYGALTSYFTSEPRAKINQFGLSIYRVVFRPYVLMLLANLISSITV